MISKNYKYVELQSCLFYKKNPHKMKTSFFTNKQTQPVAKFYCHNRSGKLYTSNKKQSELPEKSPVRQATILQNKNSRNKNYTSKKRAEKNARIFFSLNF